VVANPLPVDAGLLHPPGLGSLYRRLLNRVDAARGTPPMRARDILRLTADFAQANASRLCAAGCSIAFNHRGSIA
jgi:hypothetical protein